MPKRFPKTGVRAMPAPLFSGSSKIYRDLLSTAYEGWIVVEQDILSGLGTPKEWARRNHEYLAVIGLNCDTMSA